MVSLYSIDANSVSAAEILLNDQSIRIISPLVEFESMNAFDLRLFRKEMTDKEASLCQRNLEKDLQSGVIKPMAMPENVFIRARLLSTKFTPQLGTRTLDILHIAAALEYGATSFFSFDTRQRAMAHAVGLKLSAMPKQP